MADEIIAKIKEVRDRCLEKVKNNEMLTEQEAQELDELVFKSKDPIHQVEFLLVGDEDPTDIIRLWIAKSIPCKVCGVAGDSKPDGAGKFAFSFINGKYSFGVRFYCDECAQKIQNELVLRGIEITTKEQLDELKRKLNVEMAEPDDRSELA